MIAMLMVAAFAVPVQVDSGPPRTPPPPRQSVEQVLARMGINADSLKRLASAPRDAGPQQRAAEARAPEERGPGTARPSRRTLNELLDIVRQQPRGRALLDSLKAAGARIPEDDAVFAGEPSGTVRGPLSSVDVELAMVQQTWIITPSQPKVPGLTLMKVSPVFQDSSSGESWAMRPSNVCDTDTKIKSNPSYFQLPASPSIEGMSTDAAWLPHSEPSGQMNQIAMYSNLRYSSSCTTGTVKVVTQPEIFVKFNAPESGHYLVTLRGWGRPTVVGGGLRPYFSDSWIPVTGPASTLWMSESRNHGWNDYPIVLYFTSVGPKFFGFKVLGPNGVTFWASELSITRIL